MRIEGKEYRTIWIENNVVKIIDQTKLPHQFIINLCGSFVWSIIFTKFFSNQIVRYSFPSIFI